MPATNKSRVRTFCKRGHALTPDNIYHVKKGNERRCKKCGEIDRKLWTANNPEARVEIALRFREKRFGLPPGGYKELFDAQGGVCAICGRSPLDRALAIDHDHHCCPGLSSCGECVRGLLCMSCNTAVGKMDDNPELLRAAATYLEMMSVRGDE